MTLDFRHTRFLTSAHNPAQCPPDSGAEAAFAGRSNAGKSSALNAITGVNGLARTSKTPGRTQLINFFSINEQRRLADLPGYGYAKVPEAQRRQWRGMIEGYLSGRDSLRGVVLVMDARHPLKDFDRQMLAWSAHQGLPVHVLLTKADKLSRSEADRTLAALRRELPEAATCQLFSALNGQGVAEARTALVAWLR